MLEVFLSIAILFVGVAVAGAIGVGALIAWEFRSSLRRRR